MEEIFACLAYEPGLLDYVEFKKVKDSIWILGKEYNVSNDDDFENLNEDIKSRLWFTYRKQFEAIEDSSWTSDSGWGCMHRCGQMVLAQALIMRHLGRDWMWSPESPDETYLNILSKFDDRGDRPFSIHKIATMGHEMEKQVGQWFGPNTVIQVLKKLVEKDANNDIVIHVAMDNQVIKNEIRKLFHNKSDVPHNNSDVPHRNSEPAEGHNSRDLVCNGDGCTETDALLTSQKNDTPVLLTIPLRLGLSDILPVYFEKIKLVFKLKQTVGMIGGRTNHASYFIGFIGDELIHLDPHTTQPFRNEGMEDITYHCHHPSRMSFSELDPSIAMCFYYENEADFLLWCQEFQQVVLKPEKDALFEIMEDKIPMPPNVDLDDDYDLSLPISDRKYTSDDEFELLG